MRLICPSCGAVHSAEAWENDVEAREALRIAAGLPRPAAGKVLGYLALFRQPGSKRALQWKRARRLLEQLRDLMESPEIQWEQRPPRPNNQSAWAYAMEQLAAHPPKRLPLKTHNYLRTIVYDLCDEMDAEDERHREERIRERRQMELNEEQAARNREKIKELREKIG